MCKQDKQTLPHCRAMSMNSAAVESAMEVPKNLNKSYLVSSYPNPVCMF